MDWREIERVTVFNGKDQHGNLYLTQFLRDYKRTFNVTEINASCERCLNEYYFNFIKYLNTMSDKKQETSEYKLRKKYEGIPLKFGSSTFVTNANITDEIGDYLVKNHPRGVLLFDKCPDPEEKTDQELTLAELKVKYPMVQTSNKKATFLERVAEYQANSNEEEE